MAHPMLEQDVCREMLRDLAAAATPAEWHETLSRIVGVLLVLAMPDRRIGRPETLAWVQRVEAAVAAGPPRHPKRMRSVIAGRDLGRRIHGALGPLPTRADAVALLLSEELRASPRTRSPTLDHVRARQRLEKRIDQLVDDGWLKVSRRAKRK